MMTRIPTFGQFNQEAGYISQQYSVLANLQQQAMSGHKLVSPSDDAVLASQLQSLQDSVNDLATYSHNEAVAKARNSLFDATNTNLINTMNTIQQQLQTARSGQMNQAAKTALAAQLQKELSTLVNAANTADQDGQYVFSGTNGASPAYTLVGNTYQYQGGSSATNITIGPNVTTLYNDVGSQVFGNIPLGNGTFMVSASGSNTGTASSAVVSPGAVVNQSQYVADTYTLSIVNSGGQPYIQVTGVSSGTVIASGTLAYNPGTTGQDVNFNGITVNIGAGVNVGDSFTIQPSTKQDAFDTVQSVINTLNNTSLNDAQYNQAMSQASASISQVTDRFITYQSDAGTREQATNNQIQQNSNTNLNLKTLQSNLGDVDTIKVFSSIMQQTIALQATQQSYLQIQKTLSSLLQF